MVLMKQALVYLSTRFGQAEVGRPCLRRSISAKETRRFGISTRPWHGSGTALYISMYLARQQLAGGSAASCELRHGPLRPAPDQARLRGRGHGCAAQDWPTACVLCCQRGEGGGRPCGMLAPSPSLECVAQVPRA